MKVTETTERREATKTGFASGGATCNSVSFWDGVLCFYSSVVQVDSYVLQNPPERKAPNHSVFILLMKD